MNVRFPLRRAVMWPATRRSICYCSNSARMRFRWARLCFPCSGRRPAWDGASSRPSGCDVPVLGDAAWGPAGEIVTSRTRLASTEPWGDPWVGKGLCRGHRRGRPQPGCTQGKAGCSTWDLSGNDPTAIPGFAGEVSPDWDAPAGSVRGCRAGHPAEGTRSRRCPGPAPAPVDGKSRLAGGPGAAQGPSGQVRAASGST